MGGFLLKTSNDVSVVTFKFPSPLEGWVGSYLSIFLVIGNKNKVSVPSRGMGGFLLNIKELVTKAYKTFPSPLEGWVVSYRTVDNLIQG